MDGFSLANWWWSSKFAKHSPCQTFLACGITCFTKKVVAVVMDNARNMVNTISELDLFIPSQAFWVCKYDGPKLVACKGAQWFCLHQNVANAPNYLVGLFLKPCGYCTARTGVLKTVYWSWPLNFEIFGLLGNIRGGNRGMAPINFKTSLQECNFCNRKSLQISKVPPYFQ